MPAGPGTVAPATNVALDVKPTDWGLQDPLDQATKALNLKSGAQAMQQRAQASQLAGAEGAQRLQAGALGIQQTQQDLKDQQILGDVYRSMGAPAPGQPPSVPGGSPAPPAGGVPQGPQGTNAIDPSAILMRALQDPRGLSGKAASALLGSAMEYRAKNAAIQKDQADTASKQAETNQKRNEAVFGATGGLLQMDPADRAAAFPAVRQRVIDEGHVDPSQIPEDYAQWGGDAQLTKTHLAFGTQAGIDSENAAKLKLASDKAEEARKAALAPSALAKSQSEATSSANTVVTGAPNAAGLTPQQQKEADDRAAALAQTTANQKQERILQAKEVAAKQLEVGLKQKQFDATFGQGLDANGRPLSPEDRKNAALLDPTAKAQADYQIPPPSSARTTALGKSQWDKILAINPNYDGTKFAERNKIAQDFSASGNTGKAITNADTALAHLNSISIAGKALDNGDVKALNALANEVGAQIGASPKNTYDTIVQMVSPEISKAVIGEAGGEGERQAMGKNFSSNTSTPVREQAIGAAAGLLGARVHKQAQAYESDMGKPLERKLSPESQAVLDRYSGANGPVLSTGHKVGDVVTVRGKQIKITSVGPNDTFQGEEQK